MTYSIGYILFLTFALSVLAGIHFYLWHRLVKKTALNKKLHKITSAIIIILALLMPINMILLKFYPLNAIYSFAWLMFLWLGLMFFLFFWLIVSDFIYLIIFLMLKTIPRRKIKLNPQRREFIARAVAVNSLVLSSGMGILGVKNYYADPIIKKIDIRLHNLPNIFKGFKILQISDLHLGQMMDKEKLSKVVEQVNLQNPDLIVITGDLVDGRVEVLSDEIQPLKNLKSPYGTFFITGNHEYYSGVESWIKEITKLNIKVLQNEAVRIKKDNDFIYLSGVHDYGAEKTGSDLIADYEKALGKLDKNKNIILLAHQPSAIKKITDYKVDLMLSGHTHGGQIWPFNYLVGLLQPHMKGLKKYRNTQLYINQGTGCWGPPLRVGTFNEITKIILV
ncbi:MAG: hypothetical protein DRQ51_08570 [Gammaproteobacteria bacterium]|nr:MAG: hypothetical protein DRQ51_08570 [Gammaproteobacteria bacterium]